MGTIFVDTLEPQSGTSLAVGESGQNTVIGGNTIKLNTLKDAGANTLFVSNGSGTLSSVNAGFGSAYALISTQTASNSASLSFTSGLSSTYVTYMFRMNYIAPQTDDAYFEFQGSTDGGSNYNTTMTTTLFRTYHAENNTAEGLGYQTSDQAQGTAFQPLMENEGMSNSADSCFSCELLLFNPSSTTYVKNFYSRGQQMTDSNTMYSVNPFVSGYFDTTSAINAIQFKYNTGNIVAGNVKMYGMK